MAPTLDTTTTLLKRDSSNASKFSLYVFCIIVGCVAFVLIGFGIWTMYHPLDSEHFADVPVHQRKYMREVRQRHLNDLAIMARRPDMIIPLEELGH